MTDHRTLLILTLLLAIVPPARAFAQEGPEVYQPGTFSTGAWDFFVALTPDQRTAYICRTWRRARPLHQVNSPKGDFNHSVSPDGKYLYFSSTRGLFDSVPPAPLPYREMQRRLTGIGNGLGDIYRIPIAELDIRAGD